MKERPILFNAPMVRAILSGQKTQTRRICKPRSDWLLGSRCVLMPHELAGEVNQGQYGNSPFGQPGDRLWVREAWALDDNGHEEWAVFRADGDEAAKPDGAHWSPSTRMPRWASRITLEIISVRVERLQGITADDAMAEGIVRQGDGGYAADKDGRHYHAASAWHAYASLWEQINGAGSWATNPWVWVVKFRRLP